VNRIQFRKDRLLRVMELAGVRRTGVGVGLALLLGFNLNARNRTIRIPLANAPPAI